MSFGIPVRNGLGLGLTPSTTLSSGRIGGRPALILNFIGTTALDSRVTFTRASTATVTNSSGVIQSSAINDPRFDYDPVTLASKGLLIEEQRTNRTLYSEDFTQASWTKSLSAMAGTFTTAPDGTNTGAKWREDTSNNTHQLYAQSTLTAAAYTESWFLQAAERTKVQVSLGTAALAYGVSVIADLSAGTLSAVTNVGGHTGGSATITSFGNGWYRVTLTATATAATWYSTLWMVTGTSTTSYTGDGVSGIYVWGAQLEAGAFATSYIPTVASTVTRSADVATMTGTNFSSWYNQSEGTFIGNFTALQTVSGTSGVFASTTGSANDEVYGYYSPTLATVRVAAGGVQQANMTTASVSAGNTYKLAAAYKVNNFATSLSGGTVTTDTSGTVPTTSQLSIGARSAASGYINGYIRTIAYYNTRLPNATLQALTA